MVKKFPQYKLQEALYKCVDDIVRRKCSLYAPSQEITSLVREKKFSYNGFIFEDGFVYSYNLMIYDDRDWDNPELLDVTAVCMELLNHYNVLHAIDVLSFCMKKYYRENLLTENNYLHFKYYDRQYKQKRRHATEKHRNRQGKHISSDGNEVLGLWHSILLQAATKDVLVNAFREYKTQRFSDLYFLWNTQPIFSRISHKQHLSQGVRRRSKKSNKR